MDTIMTETLGVQNGLPGLEMIGAITNGDIDNATKLRTFLNNAFPSVKIYADTQTFNNVINSDNVKVYLKGDEIIYGVTVDGDIYINPDTHNSESALFNTTIHEMGHVWTDYLQTTERGTKIYKKGIELAKQTEEYQRQLKNFNGNSIKADNETLAVLIGNKGETIADASIKSKFDEIVDFSGVNAYIDTPVKRYSSGMYVRLAFAVAAFLNPEILIVDEVLAVGDSEFQKKCMDRMKSLSANEGKTILFVSHNLAAVKALCNSGIYLKNGTLNFQGIIDQTIETYLNDTNGQIGVPILSRTDKVGNEKMRNLYKIKLSDRNTSTFEKLHKVVFHPRI
jgi:ABC-type Na+ transport system ATPase subunit NatA